MANLSLEVIVANALEGKSADIAPHFMAVLAAPRGGKSEMVELLLHKKRHHRDDAPTDTIINPAHTIIISDALFKDWAPRKSLKRQGIQHAEKTSLLVDDYQHAVESIIRLALQRHISIVLEDLGDQPEWLKQMIALVPPDYEKTMIGIGQSKKRFFANAEERLKNGKQVNHSRTLDNYQKLSASWNDYSHLCDYSMLYYRSAEGEPHKIASFVKGKTEKIYEPEDYRAFQRQQLLEPTLAPQEAWEHAKRASESADFYTRMAHDGRESARHVT